MHAFEDLWKLLPRVYPFSVPMGSSFACGHRSSRPLIVVCTGSVSQSVSYFTVPPQNIHCQTTAAYSESR